MRLLPKDVVGTVSKVVAFKVGVFVFKFSFFWLGRLCNRVHHLDF